MSNHHLNKRHDRPETEGRRSGGLFALASGLVIAALGLLALPGEAQAQGSIEVNSTTPGGAPTTGGVSVTGNGRTSSCQLQDGRCTVTNLPSGSYVVTVTTPGQPPQRRNIALGASLVRLTFASPAVAPTLRLPGRVTQVGVRSLAKGNRLALQGTVTFQRGTPASGDIEVRLEERLLGGVRASSGRYAVYDLAPGSYQLTFRTSGREPIHRTVRVGSSPVTMNFVVAGSSGGAPSALALHQGQISAVSPAGSTDRDIGSGGRLVIQGTATYARGTPLAGVVEVRRNGALVGSTRVGSGRFVIYDLSPGSYQLTLRPERGQAQQRTVAVGSSPITVLLVVP